MSSNLITEGIVNVTCSLCGQKTELQMHVGESLGSFIDRIVILLLSECPALAEHGEIGMIQA